MEMGVVGVFGQCKAHFDQHSHVKKEKQKLPTLLSLPAIVIRRILDNRF